MKKLFIVAITALGFTFATQAQDNDATGGQAAQGNWLVEVNTALGSNIEGGLYGLRGPGNTGFSLVTVDGETIWNVGGEAGYYVADNFAVKLGLGYGQFSGDGIFSYKVGAKYYICGQVPVAIDLNGASTDNYSPMYVGAQVGYAWFLGDNISIEPALRYDYGMNDDSGDGDYNPLSVQIGLALHF